MSTFEPLKAAVELKLEREIEKTTELRKPKNMMDYIAAGLRHFLAISSGMAVAISGAAFAMLPALNSKLPQTKQIRQNIINHIQSSAENNTPLQLDNSQMSKNGTAAANQLYDAIKSVNPNKKMTLSQRMDIKTAKRGIEHAVLEKDTWMEKTPGGIGGILIGAIALGAVGGFAVYRFMENRRAKKFEHKERQAAHIERQAEFVGRGR